MGLRNGILIRIRKKHIRIGNKFDCVEGVTLRHSVSKLQLQVGSESETYGVTCNFCHIINSARNQKKRYSQLQRGWHRILRSFLKTFN